MKKVLIFTATYNESGNITDLIKDLSEKIPEADILVIDDNSQDGTGKILDNLQATSFPQLIPLHRPKKLGLGTAHKLAMKYAIHNEYDIFFSMDADFSHDPKYLPTMLEKLKDHDYVIGSRYAKGGRCDYGIFRILLSRGANFLTRFLLGVHLRETTTSLRGFKIEVLKKFPIDKIKSDGYSFFVEQTFFVSRISKKLTEIPIHFQDRRAGTSKINKKEIIKGVTTLFKLFFKRLFIKKTFLRYTNNPTYHSCNNCKSLYSIISNRKFKCLQCGHLYVRTHVNDLKSPNYKNL